MQKREAIGLQLNRVTVTVLLEDDIIRRKTLRNDLKIIIVQILLESTPFFVSLLLDRCRPQD